MQHEIPAEPLSDEQLMEAYRDGDIRAFDELFRRYRDILYRYLARQSGSLAVAEEISQESWAALIKYRKNYSVQAKFKTYLFRIVHSKLIDYYRQTSREKLQSYDEEFHDSQVVTEVSEQPEHQVDVGNRVEHLLRLLDKLPASQRNVFLMHEEAGMSLSEIAEVMQVSRDTAKSRLRYALQRLRRDMAKYA